MVNALKHKKELDHLRTENEIVDDMLTKAVREKVVSHFEIKDLKKKQSILKHSISQLESTLINNIVA